MRIFFLTLPLLFFFTIAGCDSLNVKVKDKIEKVGTQLTTTPVTVKEVDLNIARGKGTIHNFKVANPEGYTDQYAIDWKLLELNIGIISTVAGDPIKLDRLVVSSPTINFEKNGEHSSNLREIAENCQKNIESAEEEETEADSTAKKGREKPQRLKIKELSIEGVTLNVRTLDRTLRSVTLPPVTLTDIGGHEGVTPAGLGLVVVGAISGEMLKQAVARELIERAGDIRKALAADNILAILDEKLNLSEQQHQKIRPIVENFSLALTSTMDIWVEQEHVDLEILREELSPAVADFTSRLEVILESEQFQIIQSQLTQLQDNAVEIVLFVAIEQISTRTEIPPEQLRELRPILREHLVKLSNLVQQFRDNPEETLKTFEPLYMELAQNLQSQLKEKLTAEQLEKLTLLLTEMRDRIQAAQLSAL